MAVTRVKAAGLGVDTFNLPITLNGTDGSSTDAGDNIILDASASGVDAGERMLYEGIPPNDLDTITSGAMTLDGAGIVTFKNAKSVAMKLIASATADNDATIDFTSGITSDYSEIILQVTDAKFVGDSDIMLLRMGPAGGLESGAGTYQYATLTTEAGSALNHADSDSATEIRLHSPELQGNAGNESFSGSIHIGRPGGSLPHHVWGQGAYQDVGNKTISYQFGGLYVTAEAITQVRLFNTTGGFTSGEFRLYGILDS